MILTLGFAGSLHSQIAPEFRNQNRVKLLQMNERLKVLIDAKTGADAVRLLADPALEERRVKIMDEKNYLENRLLVLCHHMELPSDQCALVKERVSHLRHLAECFRSPRTHDKRAIFYWADPSMTRLRFRVSFMPNGQDKQKGTWYTEFIASDGTYPALFWLYPRDYEYANELEFTEQDDPEFLAILRGVTKQLKDIGQPMAEYEVNITQAIKDQKMAGGGTPLHGLALVGAGVALSAVSGWVIGHANYQNNPSEDIKLALRDLGDVLAGLGGIGLGIVHMHELDRSARQTLDESFTSGQDDIERGFNEPEQPDNPRFRWIAYLVLNGGYTIATNGDVVVKGITMSYERLTNMVDWLTDQARSQAVQAVGSIIEVIRGEAAEVRALENLARIIEENEQNNARFFNEIQGAFVAYIRTVFDELEYEYLPSTMGVEGFMMSSADRLLYRGTTASIYIDRVHASGQMIFRLEGQDQNWHVLQVTGSDEDWTYELLDEDANSLRQWKGANEGVMQDLTYDLLRRMGTQPFEGLTRLLGEDHHIEDQEFLNRVERVLVNWVWFVMEHLELHERSEGSASTQGLEYAVGTYRFFFERSVINRSLTMIFEDTRDGIGYMLQIGGSVQGSWEYYLTPEDENRIQREITRSQLGASMVDLIRALEARIDELDAGQRANFYLEGWQSRILHANQEEIAEKVQSLVKGLVLQRDFPSLTNVRGRSLVFYEAVNGASCEVEISAQSARVILEGDENHSLVINHSLGDGVLSFTLTVPGGVERYRMDVEEGTDLQRVLSDLRTVAMGHLTVSQDIRGSLREYFEYDPGEVARVLRDARQYSALFSILLSDQVAILEELSGIERDDAVVRLIPIVSMMIEREVDVDLLNDLRESFPIVEEAYQALQSPEVSLIRLARDLVGQNLGTEEYEALGQIILNQAFLMLEQSLQPESVIRFPRHSTLPWSYAGENFHGGCTISIADRIIGASADLHGDNVSFQLRYNDHGLRLLIEIDGENYDLSFSSRLGKNLIVGFFSRILQSDIRRFGNVVHVRKWFVGQEALQVAESALWLLRMISKSAEEIATGQGGALIRPGFQVGIWETGVYIIDLEGFRLRIGDADGTDIVVQLSDDISQVVNSPELVQALVAEIDHRLEVEDHRSGDVGSMSQEDIMEMNNTITQEVLAVANQWVSGHWVETENFEPGDFLEIGTMTGVFIREFSSAVWGTFTCELRQVAGGSQLTFRIGLSDEEDAENSAPLTVVVDIPDSRDISISGEMTLGIGVDAQTESLTIRDRGVFIRSFLGYMQGSRN